MKKEKKLKVQTLLRKQEPTLVKHMMSREDLSSLASEREALRQARSEGRLDFLYKGHVMNTRFQTETEENHIKKMAEKAEKHVEKEAGAGEEMYGAMEEPMMESKTKQDQLQRIILEEINSVLSEQGKVTKSGKRIRRPRAWFRKKRWPFKRFPAYWQGEPGKNASSKVHIASFKAFYKEVRKNPEARKQLGSRDFHWGDRHADAYATLQERPGGMPGPEGEAKVTEPETRELQRTMGEDPCDRDCRTMPTEKARLICQYEKATCKLEQARKKLQEIPGRLAKIKREVLDARDRTLAPGGEREPKEVRQKRYRDIRALEGIKQRLPVKIAKLEKLIPSYVRQIKQLAGKKYEAPEGDIKRMRLFVTDTAIDAMNRAKRLPLHELGEEIRVIEAILAKGGIPSDMENKVRKILQLYKAEYQPITE